MLADTVSQFVTNSDAKVVPKEPDNILDQLAEEEKNNLRLQKAFDELQRKFDKEHEEKETLTKREQQLRLQLEQEVKEKYDLLQKQQYFQNQQFNERSQIDKLESENALLKQQLEAIKSRPDQLNSMQKDNTVKLLFENQKLRDKMHLLGN